MSHFLHVGKGERERQEGRGQGREGKRGRRGGTGGGGGRTGRVVEGEEKGKGNFAPTVISKSRRLWQR